MRIFFIIINLLVLWSDSFAQRFNANAGSTGTIFTTEGKFSGTLDVNPEANQVLWKSENKSRIFSAEQIKSVEVSTANQQTITFLGLKLGEKFYLFEVLSYGSMVILYHKDIVKDQLTDEQYPDFFVLENGSELKALYKKRDLMDALGSDAKWMNDYIKSKQLNPEVPSDLQQIADYYNEYKEAFASGS